MKLRVVKHEAPHDDYHVLECDFDRKMFWTPGVYGIFSLPGREVQGNATRYFSIASIDDEKRIKLATRIHDGGSHFKECLAQLNEGDEIEMEGPYGEFSFRDESSPVIMVAGGVGITPMRALFKELEKGNKRPVHLVYSTKGQHLFKDELCAIADADEKILVDFVSGREELTKHVDQLIEKYNNEAYYYISGPPGMANAIAEMLDEKWINEDRVIVESFTGY